MTRNIKRSESQCQQQPPPTVTRILLPLAARARNGFVKGRSAGNAEWNAGEHFPAAGRSQRGRIGLGCSIFGGIGVGLICVLRRFLAWCRVQISAAARRNAGAQHGGLPIPLRLRVDRCKASRINSSVGSKTQAAIDSN
jgi:hypothetical protein